MRVKQDFGIVVVQLEVLVILDFHLVPVCSVALGMELRLVGWGSPVWTDRACAAVSVPVVELVEHTFVKCKVGDIRLAADIGGQREGVIDYSLHDYYFR